MMYTVSFENNNTIEIEANSLSEAEFIAYCSHNFEAIGMHITGEDGAFMSVCRKAWDEMLEKHFEGFTISDVLAHLIINAYAWFHFDKVTHFDYYEECEVTTLCAEGFAYIKEHDRLGNYMQEIGFRW